MSTQERIKQEAELMPEKLGWSNDGTAEGADIKRSYMAGALSERNKTIEEVREEIEKEKNRSLNQTTRSHADIGYEFGLDFTLRLLDSITPKT